MVAQANVCVSSIACCEGLDGVVMTWRVFGAFITSCSLHKATAYSCRDASSCRRFYTA
jgi:hypothetical protein